LLLVLRLCRNGCANTEKEKTGYEKDEFAHKVS